MIANRHTRRLLLSATMGLALVVAASGTLLVTSAQAAGEQLTDEQKAACKADFQRLCPGTMPGGGRVKQCFEAHLEELSPTCAEAFLQSTAGAEAPAAP